MARNNSVNNTSDTFSTTTFSATAMQASSISFDSGSNLMSHYTVTTFTPSLAIGGSTSGISYSSRSGTYIRIGKFASITMQMALSSKGSSSGDLRISLGFTTNSAANLYFPFAGQAITLPLNGQFVLGQIIGNDIFLYSTENGGSAAPMDDTMIGNSTEMYFNFSFVTT